MRTEDRISIQITALEERCAVWRAYLQHNVDIANWHGVEDAASDLRDFEAEIKALKWALGKA